MLTTWREVGNQLGDDKHYVTCTQSLGVDSTTWEMNDKVFGPPKLLVIASNVSGDGDTASIETRARNLANQKYPTLHYLTTINTLPVKLVPYVITARGSACELVYNGRPNDVRVLLVTPGSYPPPLTGIEIGSAAPVRLPETN